MSRKTDLKTCIRVGVLALSVLFLSQCKKDDLETSQSGLPKLGTMADGVKLAATGITSSSYYLVNSLPSGYVKDGSKDYTSYIQEAVNKYSNVVIPGFPILVNDAGIKIGSNKTLTFEDGSELRLKSSSKEGYSIIRISGATNVTLYNPVIIGDRTSHLGTTGEWGNGIAIYASSNISVYNANVTNCWGDGIYLGQASGVNCKNIILKDIYLRNNRRDGISIIGVDGLLVENMYAGYNAGTQPGTGVNFEANNATSEMKNIVFKNLTTESNGERGMQFGAKHMLAGSSNKTIDLTFINHVDKTSPFSAFKFSVKNLDGTPAKMLGAIKFVNPSWQRTANDRPLHILTDQTGVDFEISSPEIITAAGKNMTFTEINTFLSKVNSIVSVLENAPSSVDDPIVPSSNANVVFAVNAGGSAYTASNGIVYSADKNFSGGSIFKNTAAISNTADDILYQSERFGDFGYDIPLNDGTYEITFRFAEIFQQASSTRQFDVLAENNAIVSNLDIFKEAGAQNAYDVVKTVTVSDGTLNIDFRTDIDNAKVSAFHIIKK